MLRRRPLGRPLLVLPRFAVGGLAGLAGLASVVTVVSVVDLAGQGARAADAEPVSLTSLLREMTDRDRLARWPDPEFTCRQASSTDRSSVAPGGPGWYANDDNSNYLRPEEREGRRELVMLDVEGPGAVVRFWSGDSVGKVRFHLDGSERPAIEEPMQAFLRGESFVKPPFAAVRALGSNLYLPVPYARRCKITYDGPNHRESGDGKHAVWYNIEYRTYAPGTAVRTFSMEDFRAAAAVEGAIEGEAMKVLVKTGGETAVQDDPRWSGAKQLWWLDAKPGDRLELELPVRDAGRYEVVMQSTRAFDYGTFQFRIDGGKLGGPVDLYSSENVVERVTLGTIELEYGGRSEARAAARCAAGRPLTGPPRGRGTPGCQSLAGNVSLFERGSRSERRAR